LSLPAKLAPGRLVPSPIARISDIWYNQAFRNEDFVESAKVGKRGAIIVPARLRKRFGIEEGSMIIAEEKDDGILIRPAVIVPVEMYSPERKAEFLLANATSQADYRRARKAVRELGLDPDSIPHRRPA
jgi:AbrB family looped-hinge helix DNA binding protein